MAGFPEMHGGALTDGALSTSIKELMALAISIADRRDGCIAYHVPDALKAGATKEEVTESIGVAILMGGGPASCTGRRHWKRCSSSSHARYRPEPRGDPGLEVE
jgi:AhpD family alkylhydroperoxidase